MKKCSKCKLDKPKSEFCKDVGKKDGLCSHCKSCTYKRGKEYSKTSTNKKYRRKYHLKKKYGITLEDYDKILESQNGKCAICEIDNPGNKGRFCVDHDHETGKNRGLICDDCNVGLGRFKDSTNILTKAIEYLVKNT